MQGTKSRSNIRSLILTGMFIALGILIPQFAGHAAGIPGTVLLPMHFPVLLCGLFLGWQYGAVCGIITPLLSSFITGMPPLWPVLPGMMVELCFYGLVGGLLYRKLKLPVFAALPIAMVAGRVAYGFAFAIINTQPNVGIIAASIWSSVVTGLPGIAIQLVFIPLLVLGVERALKSRSKEAAEAPAAHGTPASSALEKATDEIRRGGVSCVVVQNGEIVHRADGRGVSPLVALYEENPALLENAEVADKIIGKAAAMILHLGKAGFVHGEIMSEAAAEYLAKAGIPYSYGRKVDIISNRTGSGICPIEKSVFELDDPLQGYAVIKQTVQALRIASGQ